MLAGRKISDGGRKTHLQPPLLRAAGNHKEERERRRGHQGGEEEWHRRDRWGGNMDEGNERGKKEERKEVGKLVMKRKWKIKDAFREQRK